MNYCWIRFELDLFNHKQKILKSLGTDDIEYELKKRKESDIYVKDRSILYTEIDLELSDYDSEILDDLTDDEMLNELKIRGYKVFNKNEYPSLDLATKEDICTILGLKKWATKEQILSELNIIL